MKLSRRWLEAFLGRSLDPRDVAERLAMLGAPVDAIEPLHRELDALVVAVVDEVRPHPNADRLRLCRVNDGSGEPRQVVCGALNVTAGGRYPFARLGATLPGGVAIARRKIRGEVSEGMLCSGRELGLSDDHDGLLALDTEAGPGTPLLAVLPVDDDRFVVDVTPNRGDLNGHKGVARELAAAYAIPFRLPAIPGGAAEALPAIRRQSGPAVTGTVQVTIEAGGGCGRFLGAVVRGVRVGPSPLWLRQRVEAGGMRSINTVVDATNYILLELNQPLHAYDLNTLRGGRIAARAARAGELLRTLDGLDRALTEGTPVIADGEGVIGVAGVMGGAATEVTPDTTDLFLECAWFEPTRVRTARRALGLATEASHRFERGTDLQAAPEALRRGLELLVAVAGGVVVESPVDIWPEPQHPPRIFLRLARVAQVLGVELPLHAIERALVATGATVVAKPDDARIAVEPPGWRPDLTGEIDLIEEIARIHGYGEFPEVLRPFRPGSAADAPLEAVADRLRRLLAGRGLLEQVALGLVPATGEGVRVLNPLSQDHAELRGSLLPGLLRATARNWDHQVRDIRLFEIGTVFLPGPIGAAPTERIAAAGVLSGGARPPHWSDGGRTPAWDLWDLSNLFEAVVGLAYPGASVQVEGDGWVARTPEGEVVGRASGQNLEGPPWVAPVLGFEVRLAGGVRVGPRHVDLPSYPAIERDLALLLPEGVAAGEVATLLRRCHPLVATVQIVDEYRGAGLPPGRRSVAFRLALRAPDRTLRDREIEPVVRSVLGRLENELDVTLRTT